MENEIKVEIGKTLFLLRHDNNLSIENLSEKSGLNKDTLYRYEKGNGNNFDTLASILKVYDLDFNIFFTKVYDRMQNNKKQNVNEEIGE